MTKATTQKEIIRKWHLVDAKGKTLGRLASDIAQKLMGKSKPYFVRNLDCGDFVVVVNAKEVVVTGKKSTKKKYNRYSGYPGGFKSETYSEVMAKDPRKIITHSVQGMLPHNKLLATMLKRLKVFAGPEHMYMDKFEKGESK